MLRDAKAQRSRLCLPGIGVLGPLTISACTLLSTAAHAQHLPQSRVEYSISSMDLGDALRAFAEQSDLQILFSPDDVENRMAAGMNGIFEPTDALEHLLAGSGLEYAYTNPKFVIVRRVKTPEQSEFVTPDSLSAAGPEALTADGAFNVQTGAQENERHEGRHPPTLMSDVDGYVTRGISDIKLVGALVSIPDLGVSQVTDGRGFFSLESVPQGRHTIEVSYFGQDSEAFIIDTVRQHTQLTLQFGSDPADEIIVSGVQSAYNNSININRTVGNVVSVLAADLDGRFPDDTIAEALRRSPGVTFERDERGGEGQFITIRGLSADYNKVMINGVASPSSGIFNDRRVALDGYLADSVSRITVNKTLLPEHSSESIGGLLEIQTTGNTYSQDPRLTATAEGRYSDFNDKVGFLLSGQFSDTLGSNEQYQLYASASFRRRLLRTYQFDVLGDTLPDSLPIGSDGVPISAVSELGPFQLSVEDVSNVEDMRVNIFDDHRDVLSIVMGGSWDISNKTQISLSGTYNELEINDQRSSISFEQSDRFTDLTIDGNLINPNTGQFYFYGRSPFSRARAEVEDERSQNLILSASAATRTNNLELSYGVGFSSGRSAFPLSTEIDFESTDFDDLMSTGVPPVLPTGYSFIEFDQSNSRIPIPRLTDSGYAHLSDPANFSLRDVRLRSAHGQNDIYSAHLDSQWKGELGPLRAIKTGFLFTHSDRSVERVTLFDDDTVFSNGAFGGDGRFALSDTNLLTGAIISFDPVMNVIPQLQGIFQTDRDKVLAFREQLLSTLPDLRDRDITDDSFQKSSENTLAAYVSAEIDITPQLSLIGGVRAEQYWGSLRSSRTIEISRSGEAESHRIDTLDHVKRETTELLPRLLLTYRPNEQWVFKGGMFESIARPTFDTLNAPEAISVDLDAQEAYIDAPNPHADNIHSSNYDLSIQFFGSQGRYFEANAYYKDLSDFTIPDFGSIGGGYVSVDPAELVERLSATDLLTPSELASVQSVQLQSPLQGTSAAAYGIDLSYLHQFESKPGYWDELGVRFSANIQNTDFVLKSVKIEPRASSFMNAPSFGGTASLWHKLGSFSAYAIYSYQGHQLNTAQTLFPDEYIQPYSALDLRFEYMFPAHQGGQYSIYLAAADVLDDGLKATTYETFGPGTQLLDDVEYNGRELRFGIIGRF